MTYRENSPRYIPVKFGVRGRDLESAVSDIQELLAWRERSRAINRR